jgi:hypothetical protein
MCEAYFDTFEQMTPHFFSDDDPLTLPLLEHSGNIQGTFRVHSGYI